MLSCRGLRRSFGDVVALDGLDLDVAAGRVTGFLGPNGSGKTTTIRAVLGLTSLDAGNITLDGLALDRAGRAQFGYMPEERGLYDEMPIGEQVVLFCRLRGVGRVEADAAAEHQLGLLGLWERRHDKLKELSLGNQQRVQLAVALAPDPRVLVLDEPFSGLDPSGVDTMAERIHEAVAEDRIVVFSSHQLDLVEDLCADVVIIDAGRTVAAGAVRDLVVAAGAVWSVEVDGDPDGAFVDQVPGARRTERSAGAVRVALDPGVDPQRLLDAARASGSVIRFSRDHRRLSEVFRDATGHSLDAAEADA